MTERPVGSGAWRLRVYAGRDPITDNPIQVQRTFRGTETAARKALAKLVTDVEEGRFDKTKVTVGELLDRWLAHIEAIGKARPKTVYEYRRKIDGRIGPALGDTRLTRLEPDTLDAWYQQWLSEGLSPSTVHVYHAILSAACRQAVKWGWLDRAPTDRATAPTPRSPNMKVPTPKQLSTIMTAADESDPVLATAIALAALTGARRGEIVALRWSDVDLEAGTIRIERALTVVAGASHVGPTKTHQVRRVALDDTGVHTLDRHRQFMVDRSDLVESPLVDDPYILSYQAHCGTPVGPDTLTHRFKAICTKLEAPAKKRAKDEGRQLGPDERWDFHFHGLRHFSVTTLLAAGVDVRTVAERHGHAQATMTLNRYAHALPERDRIAAGVLGNAVNRS
jgi:integrase